MKLRRATKRVDLRNLPLDGFDMFLLTRIEGTVEFSELLAIAPCDAAETVRRLHRLVGFSVIKLIGEPPEAYLAVIRAAASESSDIDDAVTLRPPRPVSDSSASTLRPEKPSSVSKMFEAQPSSVRAVFTRAHTGVEFRTPKDAVRADGTPVRDRSLKITLVDEDAASRAAKSNDMS